MLTGDGVELPRRRMMLATSQASESAGPATIIGMLQSRKARVIASEYGLRERLLTCRTVVRESSDRWCHRGFCAQLRRHSGSQIPRSFQSSASLSPYSETCPNCWTAHGVPTPVSHMETRSVPCLSRMADNTSSKTRQRCLDGCGHQCHVISR